MMAAARGAAPADCTPFVVPHPWCARHFRRVPVFAIECAVRFVSFVVKCRYGDQSSFAPLAFTSFPIFSISALCQVAKSFVPRAVTSMKLRA